MSTPTVGTLRLVVGNDTEVRLTPAVLRAQPIRYDRRLFRPPFSSTWHVEGTGLRGAQRFVVEAEVYGSSIAAASVRLESLVSYLKVAKTIVAPFGSVAVAGLERIEVSPIPTGYALRAELTSVDGVRAYELFLYAPNAAGEEGEVVVGVWEAYLQALGHTVEVIDYGFLQSTPLAKYRAGVVVGNLDSADREWLAGAPVPLLSNLAVHEFVDEAPDSSEVFASASIVGTQEQHPTAAGLTGQVGVFTASAFAYHIPKATSLPSGVASYLEDSVRRWAVRGLSEGEQRRLGFPLPLEPDDFTTDGAALFDAALTWVLEGSSSITVDMGALGDTVVANLIGREATLIGDESILIGAETITV